MSVFTQISSQQLEETLSSSQLGQVKSLEPIAQGTVNSNFELITSAGHFVLTVFEAMDAGLAQSILNYTDFLYQAGIPCAKPQSFEQGSLFYILNKPAAITSFLPGQNPQDPSAKLCFEMGKKLSQIHQVGLHYPEQIANQMGFDWQNWAVEQLKLPNADLEALVDCLQKQKLFKQNNLPKGMIHFDCFRDNVFTGDDNITGMFDFYYACYDYLLIDMAVTLNDWCTDWEQCSLDVDKAQQFLAGYQQHRALEPKEQAHLLDALTLMAAHFWMSRTLTLQQAKQGEGHFEKDPAPFKQLFSFYKTKLQASEVSAWLN